MNRRRSLAAAAILVWVGVLLSVLFLFDVYPPRRLAVVLLLGFAVWGMAAARGSRLAALQRLVILIYYAPFAVTLGYLVDENFLWAATPARIVLIEDDRIILHMLATGLVGLVGLLAGMKIAEILLHSREHQPRPARIPSASMPWLAFAGFAGATLALVWAGSGDSPTVFEAGYAGTTGAAQAINFNAATLLGNVILLLLFVDAERSAVRKMNPRMVIVTGLAVAAVAYELLRGNRDSFGLLVALLALYATGSLAQRLRLAIGNDWTRLRRVIVPAVVIVAVFVLAGALRAMMTTPQLLADPGYVLRVAFLENTWTAILHSNLGLASLYASGPADYLLGRTYIDYLLSAPPGFLTQWFDITRPIEADRGPAWWFMGITGGGVHAVVVPFRNFGIVGAMAVLALVGALVTWMDAPNASPGRRFLYGVVMAASFKWLWYGDMSLIRALMAAALVWVAYRIVMARRVPA